MVTGSIYMISNNLNAKVYIGKTIRPIQDRFKSHCYEAKSCKYTSALHAAIRKYGENSFSIKSIVTNVPEIFLDSFEKYWIHFYSSNINGYNLTDGGDGVTGYKHTAETRDKMSTSQKGKKLSDSHKKSLKDAWKVNSESNKKRLSHLKTVNIGRVLTKEQREIISKNQSGALSHRAKKVRCITTGVVYNTVTEAALAYNTSTSNISGACSGKYKSCKGVEWSYTMTVG